MGKSKKGTSYELPFDGSDAHAEVIERTTGLRSWAIQPMIFRKNDPVI